MGGKHFSNDAQIRVIGRVEPEIRTTMLKTLCEKTRSKIPCHYTWLLHRKNCPSRWRFHRSFVTESKPSRRSITPAKRKEKEKKERRKTFFDSLPFLSLASRFMTFWLGHALKSKFWDVYVLRLFDFWNVFIRLSFFSFSFFLFAAVIDILPGLLAVKKLLRKRHRDGQFLRWSSQV